MGVVYCYRNGRIGFARKAPEGTLTLMIGRLRALRPIVDVLARHAYDNVTLLVPGIPEAAGSEEAVEAARTFQSEIRRRYFAPAGGQAASGGDPA